MGYLTRKSEVLGSIPGLATYFRFSFLKEDWEKHRKDTDICQFYSIKGEVYVANGLVFRLNQIIIPLKLRKKVIKAAHSLGHLGMNKTKQMIRQKYWFPEMNKMVDHIVGQCYECQVTTKEYRQEPLKITEIPEKTITSSFGGHWRPIPGWAL